MIMMMLIMMGERGRKDGQRDIIPSVMMIMMIYGREGKEQGCKQQEEMVVANRRMWKYIRYSPFVIVWWCCATR